MFLVVPSAALAAHLGARGWQAALVAIPLFGAVYLGAMTAAGVPEARGLVRRLLRRRRRARPVDDR